MYHTEGPPRCTLAARCNTLRRGLRHPTAKDQTHYLPRSTLMWNLYPPCDISTSRPCLQVCEPTHPLNSARSEAGIWIDGRRQEVARRHDRPEESITKLREAELLLARRKKPADAAKELGIHKVTCYRWRTECGGMRVDQMKRLNELGQENARQPGIQTTCTSVPNADSGIGLRER
jgi:putative transposase